MTWDDIPVNITEQLKERFLKMFTLERDKIAYYIQQNFTFCATTSSCQFNCKSCHPLSVLNCYTKNKQLVDSTWETK